MSEQGPSYGLSKELADKQALKYDHDLEKDVVGWITELTGEKQEDGQTVQEWLKNGQVLCKLINTIKPATVKKVNTLKSPFKEMENITFFTTASRNLGVPEMSMFATPDLYENKNMGSVINTIYQLGGVVQVSVPEFKGPHIGVAIDVHIEDAKRSGGVATQTAGLAGTLEADTGAHVRDISSAAQVNKESAPTGQSGKSSGFAPGGGGGYAAAADAPKKTAAQTDDANYGINKELQDKQGMKYDHDLEKNVVDWIEKVTGEKKDGDATVQEWLKNGQVLCKLVNKIKPDTVKKINTLKSPFKEMENITYFTTAGRAFGVPEMSMFATGDLYEDKNMGSVINCIYQVAGVVQVSVPEFKGPHLGHPIDVAIIDGQRHKGAVTQTGGLAGTLEADTAVHGRDISSAAKKP